MFKQIQEYVEGDACGVCWGVGKAFGVVETPKRILITGSGFVGACAVCNGSFIAEQVPTFPCRYAFDDGSATGVINFGVVNTAFSMGISGGGPCYGKNEGLCVLTSTDAGKTVSLSIIDPPTPEWKIAIEQNFSPSLETHSLNLGAANGDEVLVLARRRDRVKLHVRFSPEY